ncbi:MAG: DUF4382 domain-containing protein [Leptolyngbya sp. SIO4C5]|uniref:DUF4382 domain-containing protein n=1 Tax=Sphaerothrix gracilis TaxID=3151835 RepID=UPI0013BFC982|nr:DUF4382 domain-containing protein [Leptolyngbya sp. SIO4C5]
MNRSVFSPVTGAAVVMALLGGCATADQPGAETSSEPGTLALRANGEDFVRQGFVTKDGWQINFDHVYVSLADVKAYQTSPPFDADAEAALEAEAEVPLVKAETVDLAAGDAEAEPILVTQVEAPAGQYNALSWEMVPASEGPAAGQVLMLVGTAEKAGETVDFTLKFDQPYAYVCGDFVGENRKGILEPADSADVEATFHFDHIFGDGEAAPEAEINTGALGFEPIAALATDQQVEADLAALEQQLASEDYAQLQTALQGLAHVGEGHCRATEVTS